MTISKTACTGQEWRKLSLPGVKVEIGKAEIDQAVQFGFRTPGL